jgi:DNA helicase-2/ATP-dependent DNA helicase PcrA
MSGKNRIVVAAAGSGKTTYLVRRALEASGENVAILTYTESNEAEIRKKIQEQNGYIPNNIFVSTWFSFLISHGIRPFQGNLFEFDVRGMILTDKQSAFRFFKNGRPVFWGEKDFERHYFDRQRRIYSDKLSKLVIRCNEASSGSVFDRLSRIYPHVLIDEMQDLAGYDFDIVSGIFNSSSTITLVGDPRQVTYQTHHERKYEKYSGGRFLEFFRQELPKATVYEIDETTLTVSHRNSPDICAASSKLFPDVAPTQACTCEECRNLLPEYSGLFLVRRADVTKYLEEFYPVQLRYSAAVATDPKFAALNFGESKGLGFDRVLIYLTEDMTKWMKNNQHPMKPQTRARFYVALTRARHSAALVYDFDENELIPGYKPYVA